MPRKDYSYRIESFNSNDDLTIDEPLPSTSRSQEQQSVPLGEMHHSSKETEPPISKRSSKIAKNEANSTVHPEDCCCPPRFFTTRLTVFNTVAFLIIVTLVVLILDLEINERESAAKNLRYVPMKDVYPNGTRIDFLFILHGNPTAYESFETIPYGKRSNIRSIDLAFVDINITKFMNTIEYGFDNLESMSLRNVRFEGMMPWSQKLRPTLPTKFKNFYLEYNGPIGLNSKFTLELCDICFGESFHDIGTFIDPTCLEYLIFYNTPYHVTKKLSHLKFNIHITIWGLTYLHLNFDTKELISSLPYTDDIIADLASLNLIKKLSVRGGSLNLDSLALLAPVLDELHLDHVVIFNSSEQSALATPPSQPNISKILNNFTHLQQLTLNFGNYIHPPSPNALGETETSTLLSDPTITINLDDIPTTIRNLSLGHVRLLMNPNSTINFHLDQLSLYYVMITEPIVTDFSKHFVVNEVYWHVYNNKSLGPRLRISWGEILEGVSNSNPNSIFIDNSLVGTLIATMRLTVRPRYSVVPYFASNDEAFTARKKTRTSSWTNIPNINRTTETQESSRIIWFKVLRKEKFLNEQLIDELIW